MTNPRSTLESLNSRSAGRTPSHMDELNRTLESLESRLLELEVEAPYQPNSRPNTLLNPMLNRQPFENNEQPFDHRFFTPAPTGDRERPTRKQENAAGLAELAEQLQRMRGSLHENTSPAPLIPAKREHETLSHDMSRLRQHAMTDGYSDHIDEELNRISDSVRILTKRDNQENGRENDERLHSDLEDLKRTVQTLARDESLRRLSHRWDSFDEKFDAFEARQNNRDQRGQPALPVLDAIAHRLDEVRNAIGTLPQSHASTIRVLETRIETLAGSIQHVMQLQQAAAQPHFVQELDARLDEISRAILSSSVSRKGDPEELRRLDRIETRLAGLTEQIDDVAKEHLSGTLLRRMNDITERVDILGENSRMPVRLVEQLSEQINVLVAHIDHSVTHNSPVDFTQLENRLDLIARKLNDATERFARADTSVIHEMDRRFAHLARHLDKQLANNGPDPRLFQGLEGRLEDISQQLSVNAAHAGQHDKSDSTIIRSLEAQVASIAQHLATPQNHDIVLKQLNPRLEKIEHAVASNRQTVMDAARMAAESAVAQIARHNSPADTAIVRELAQHMKSLETLARRGDERNGRTFEAVHDTLVKIVDRLAALENGTSLSTPAKASMADVASTTFAPPFAARIELPISPPKSRNSGQRSPASAAVDAAMAAVEREDEHIFDPESGKSVKKASFLSSFAKVVRGSREPTAITERHDPQATLQTETDIERLSEKVAEDIDPQIANQPLEPGSGMPDLNTIMKRVRDERREAGGGNSADVNKADFIAAARRAAQAAAEESARLKSSGGRRKGPKTPGKKSAIGHMPNRQRKPILLAIGAIMIAMAGLQVGSAFLGNSDETIETAALAPQTEAYVQADAVDNIPDAASERAISTPENTNGELEPAAPQTSAAPDTASTQDPIAATIETMQPKTAEPVSATIAPETSVEQPSTAATSTSAIPIEAGPITLREAAANGDARALFEIGNRYTEGRGVTANFAKAAEWYSQSAALGFAPAEYRLGNFNEKGLGMPRDTVKAQTWYQMAAQHGNASAMHNLAVLFASGANNAPDNESAARWFDKAAELGVKDSQFNLGILTAKGLGIPVDLEASYKWFALAAKAGDSDAAEKRDEVAKSLKPQQLERAKASVELWKVKPLDEATNSIDVPDAWTDNKVVTTGSVDMNKAVRNIQLILQKNGYDAGQADGVMGAKTRTAIAEFQKAHGQKPTGEVDQQLVQALLAKNT